MHRRWNRSGTTRTLTESETPAGGRHARSPSDRFARLAATEPSRHGVRQTASWLLRASPGGVECDAFEVRAIPRRPDGSGPVTARYRRGRRRVAGAPSGHPAR